jgi:hypothetical protein
MGIWSNSRNGNLRYSVNRQNNSGIFIGPTKGLSSPKNDRRGCLCVNENRYGRDCCKGYLINQGIGRIQGVANFEDKGSFSDGYNDGYDTEQTQTQP